MLKLIIVVTAFVLGIMTMVQGRGRTQILGGLTVAMAVASVVLELVPNETALAISWVCLSACFVLGITSYGKARVEALKRAVEDD